MDVPDSYLEITFDSVTTVSVVYTYSDAVTDQWVRKYRLQFKDEAGAWRSITRNGNDATFNGNYERDSAAVRVLPPGIHALGLRLFPHKYVSAPTLRWQILGCYRYGECCLSSSRGKVRIILHVDC